MPRAVVLPVTPLARLQTPALFGGLFLGDYNRRAPVGVVRSRTRRNHDPSLPRTRRAGRGHRGGDRRSPPTSACSAIPTATSAKSLGDLAKRFEARNPGTKVIIDKVPYKAVVETLPVQLAAGEGPDIARVTDLGGLNKYYLDLTPQLGARAKYWEDNFGPTLKWLRGGAGGQGHLRDDDAAHRHRACSSTRRCSSRPRCRCPAATATWDDWMEAARKVATATKTPYAMAMDRSGHRFAPLAVASGAKIFDANGNADHRRRLQGGGHQVRQLEQGRTDAEGGLGRRGRLAVSRCVRGVRQRPRRRCTTRAAGRCKRMDTQVTQVIRLDRRAGAVRSRRLHGDAGWRSVRRAEAHQVAGGCREVPRLPRRARTSTRNTWRAPRTSRRMPVSPRPA